MTIPCRLPAIPCFLADYLLVGYVLMGCVATTAAEDAPIASDESLADAYSLDVAHGYLDRTAADWVETRACITCHTNGLYLLSARAESKGLAAMRKFARDYLRPDIARDQPADKRQVSTTGLVASTALLAISEGRTENELDPLTREAFDFIWTLQSESGAWDDWLKCNWPPYEVDDHFGATLVAIAAGSAPGDYAETPAAQAGLEKLRKYFANNPPQTMHQRGMLLWASQRTAGLFSAAEQLAVADDLFALQKPDGGWNLVTLGTPPDDSPLRWKRTDGTPQDRDTSDGYATGFSVYLLRQAGVPADDPRILRAVSWLKTHQRASGRWFTRSPRVDNQHFISNAGTSFAVLALEACAE